MTLRRFCMAVSSCHAKITQRLSPRVSGDFGRKQSSLSTCHLPLVTRHSPLFFALLLLFSVVTNHCSLLVAQATTATINGQITDSQGKIVPGTVIEAVNIGTNIIYPTKANESGIYSITSLPPGPYRIHVRRDGFKDINMTGVVLHVQDTLEQNFALEVGSTSESVTVTAGQNNINTTDASVSTVVDRQFVDSMPLNGRSFQSLIELAPGVVTATPQNGTTQGTTGEYSVNGERSDANSFTVDGVSANNGIGVYGYSTAGSAGGLPATTALGTTQTLVSVDALQEFRLQTSTYSAEYGRQPGGQISLETRAGTNEWHGSAFDYLRNTVFDANNWFNDHSTPPTQKPAERQNDFGGTLGSALEIPRVYSGRNRTFYFFSYEGLRLSQPQPATVLYVPSNQLREQAPAVLQGALNAYPLPNCTTTTNSECVDPGNGLSPFLLSTSLPSSLDAISLRIDENPTSRLHLFFRYGSAQSSSQTTATSYRAFTTTSSKTFTMGGDISFSPRVTNQLRLSYSPVSASTSYREANYGGAVSYDLQAAHNFPSNQGDFAFYLLFPGYTTQYLLTDEVPRQHQSNVVDTIVWQQGPHTWHFGIDYRRTVVSTNGSTPALTYLYQSSNAVLANSPEVEVDVQISQHPEFTNLSTFVQDEWRVSKVVNLSLGIRWEVNPPPTVTRGVADSTVNGDFGDPSSLTLAPAGSPLYSTTYYNFAPRVGLAAILRNTPGRETVFRTGGGVFYDTGQNLEGLFGAGETPGTGAFKAYPAGTAGAAFPVSPAFYEFSLASTLTPPYSNLYAPSQHLQLPYSFHWNATLEQALGAMQSISLGYVGSNGRRLLEEKYYSLAKLNPLFTSTYEYSNGLSSSYNALQVQYKRSLSRGLQALGSYTWAHALDYVSQDISIFTYQRGSSDFDVRNNFTAALSYNLPKQDGRRVTDLLLNEWGTDLRFTARSAFPVSLQGNEFLDPSTGIEAYSGLNVVPGVPVYLYGAKYPGGRSVNPAAFSLPTGTNLGDAPRNFVRGLGDTEANFVLRRDFPIGERLHLQFRAEAFNVLNHPNFGYINPTYGNALFGQATKTLASSLGGLTPLYQQGGPRSLQFSLRMEF